MKKSYDLAVVTGSYTDSNGDRKNRYENIGAVWMGDKGPFITLKAHFNPAGVARKEGSDSVFISMFKPKDKDAPEIPQPKKHEDFNPDSYNPDIPF